MKAGYAPIEGDVPIDISRKHLQPWNMIEEDTPIGITSHMISATEALKRLDALSDISDRRRTLSKDLEWKTHYERMAKAAKLLKEKASWDKTKNCPAPK